MMKMRVSGWEYFFVPPAVLFFLPRIMGADNPVTLADGKVIDLHWEGGVVLLCFWAYTLWIAYREGASRKGQ